MDWDKLRIFHAAAQAGSFTHAGEMLNMSQSAVSRQVGALEMELGIPLFHRHARGLLLTEQGDLLFRTARDVMMKLDAVQARLADSREKPSGVLRVTTTVGLGTSWLTSRLHEFLELYPDVELQVILDDSELDLSMRQADVAIRLRQPVQPDLIRPRRRALPPITRAGRRCRSTASSPSSAPCSAASASRSCRTIWWSRKPASYNSFPRRTCPSTTLISSIRPN